MPPLNIASIIKNQWKLICLSKNIVRHNYKDVPSPFRQKATIKLIIAVR